MRNRGVRAPPRRLGRSVDALNKPKARVSQKKIVRNELTSSGELADPISSSQRAPSRTCRGADDAPADDDEASTDDDEASADDDEASADDDEASADNDEEACRRRTGISDEDPQKTMVVLTNA